MVDQMLGGLFGSQDTDDEPTRRRRAQDFIDRHERGMHHQMSDAEVLQNYRATTAQLSPDEYRQTAKDAMRQMSPEQRRELDGMTLVHLSAAPAPGPSGTGRAG